MAGMAVAVTQAGLVEQSDRWVLPLAGVAITQLCIDYAVTLRCQNGLEVRIEQPFVYVTPDGRERLLVPEGVPSDLAPVLSAARRVVRSAEAFKDGHLEISIEDGTLISVPSTEDLEPWEVVGPGGLRLVSVPGGDLSVWHPRFDDHD